MTYKGVQPTPHQQQKKCMDIVTRFPGFEEGSSGYLKALCVFLNMQARENFMYPKTYVTKMEFLKMVIEKKRLSPTAKECMDIVECFPGFEEGSSGYLQALRVFLNMTARENFMAPKTDATKMEFLTMLIEKER